MKKLIIPIFFTISLITLLTTCADNSEAENTENTTTLQTVEFDADGGTPVPQLQFVYFGKKAAEPAPMTKTNYTFGGWYSVNKNYLGNFLNEYKWDFNKDIVTYNMTLYARWDLEWYKVTFESYGGANAPDYQYVKHEGKITEPDTNLMYNNRSLSFGGWYKEETFDTKWDFAADTVTENITLYAKWGYTVSYYGALANTYQVVIPGNKADKPAITTQTGYIFDDWYKENTFTAKWDFAADTVTGNIRLYAKWNPITYTVRYEKNSEDASGTMADSSHTFNAEQALTANGYARPGYAFAKWNTQSDGQGRDYLDAQPVKNITLTDGDVITLYARWGHTVDFAANGGGIVPERQIVTHGFPAANPNRVKRANYFFNGWYMESDFVNQWNFYVNTVTENITLYAKWIPNEMIMVNTVDFIMGKELGTAGNGDIEKSHSVRFTKDFRIGKYQVTQELYQAVMGNNPSYFKEGPADGEIQKNRPVENVSWYDAVKFCNELSMAEGLTPAYSISGTTYPKDWGIVPTDDKSANKSNWDKAIIVSGSNGYRLPTEAQWEYAAKGGSPLNTGWVGYTYSGSDILDDVAWYANNSNGKTHEVGKKAPNFLGIYDMTGNVFEWCWDYYGSYSSGSVTDPTGYPSGDCRIRRGGTYSDFDLYVYKYKSIYRDYYFTYRRDNNTGFRIVRP